MKILEFRYFSEEKKTMYIGIIVGKYNKNGRHHLNKI